MKKKSLHFVLFTVFLSLIIISCQADQPQNPQITYFYNGHIYSMDSSSSIFSTMIVEKGQIRAVGVADIKEQLAGKDYESIDLNGQVVFPGLIEGHGHFMSLGEVVCGLDISGLPSWGAVLDKTVEFASDQPGEGWVLGKGWHPNHWSAQPERVIEGYPDNTQLNELFPDRPVVLQHSSFHALMANKKALELAGVDGNTPDPDGGRIVRDDHGHATGMLEENAMGLVMTPYNAWKNERSEKEKAAILEQYLDSAAHRCLSYGITTFVDAGIGPSELKTYQNYHEKKGLNLRIWAMASGLSMLEGAFDGAVPYESEDNRLYLKASKAFVDGALGSNGAWMINDYQDQPGWKGQNVVDTTTLKAMGQKCIDLGIQYCVHAIGDRGNRVMLDIYEDLFNENNAMNQDLRWRIEHTQIVQPDDIGRFAHLGVIPSMQAIHCTSDAPMVEPKIGEELAREGAYPWRSLIDQNSRIANGTDTPVERVNPFENLYASVTRKSSPEAEAFYPEQCMTREEALRSLTIWNAYACKLEDKTGSLEPGKWADFMVVDTDLMKCMNKDILDAQVLETWVGGERVWERQ
ncbi:amidohydrolase [Membranicola marinus]|uniref:Amidohydrolase n=1 Tax=Membranihabitans marinus TaxID=1227546 RepID=A0A953HM29_9BACT|nr:amidohydrolase [Membranihabitans marinus]MBY5958464.1 amidohydrolase [Membranihabitans marinus]